MTFKFYTRVAKGLELKVIKFCGLSPVFVEVTGKKLVGGILAPQSPPATLKKKDFEKCLFKLRNNSAYGKTKQNLRKRINVRLVNSAKEYLSMLAKQLLILNKILVKILLAIHEIKSVVVLRA